jgi:hypothetical protein
MFMGILNPEFASHAQSLVALGLSLCHGKLSQMSPNDTLTEAIRHSLSLTVSNIGLTAAALMAEANSNASPINITAIDPKTFEEYAGYSPQDPEILNYTKLFVPITHTRKAKSKAVSRVMGPGERLPAPKNLEMFWDMEGRLSDFWLKAASYKRSHKTQEDGEEEENQH